VSSGETLSSIASSYGISLRQLAELNGLDPPYRIYAGQILSLPGKPGQPAAAVAAATKSPAPAAKPSAPPTGVSGADRYVVRRGDTLSRIAAKHGLSEAALMELNSIKNRNFIYEGQVLALAPSARTAPPAEARVPVASAVASAPPVTELVAAAEESEPVSEGEAEEIGPALVPGMQAAASADPSDYSVHDDDTVIVQAAETLGHYAEWLKVRASHLRQLNRMSTATPVVIGRKVKLDFTKVSRDQFEARRIEYHKRLQEAFFSEYRITGNDTHVIKRGESVWVLAQQRYNIPIWLLRQYNPDVDLGSIKPGTKLVIPTVERTANVEPAA
jgi:membrane-bound lytic murein transglycosylase D